MEARKLTSKEMDKLASLINDEDYWDRKPSFGVLTEIEREDLGFWINELSDEPIELWNFTEEEVWGRKLDGRDSICQADFIGGMFRKPELFTVTSEVYGTLLIHPEGSDYARYAVRIVD